MCRGAFELVAFMKVLQVGHCTLSNIEVHSLVKQELAALQPRHDKMMADIANVPTKDRVTMDRQLESGRQTVEYLERCYSVISKVDEVKAQRFLDGASDYDLSEDQVVQLLNFAPTDPVFLDAFCPGLLEEDQDRLVALVQEHLLGTHSQASGTGAGDVPEPVDSLTLPTPIADADTQTAAPAPPTAAASALPAHVAVVVAPESVAPPSALAASVIPSAPTSSTRSAAPTENLQQPAVASVAPAHVASAAAPSDDAAHTAPADSADSVVPADALGQPPGERRTPKAKARGSRKSAPEGGRGAGKKRRRVAVDGDGT